MQHFHPECQTVCFAEVFNKVILSIQDQLEDNLVAIENRVPPGLTRESDEHFLAVILRNLLLNAMRHGAGEHIVIDATSSEITITNPVASNHVLYQRIGEHRIDNGVSGLGLQLAADLASRIGARFFFRGENGVLTAVLVWGQPAVAVA